jgi:baculoviral IAP repeat-containing protein 7/8
MHAEANAAIIPCGHTVACVRCLERCEQCPVCRKGIDSILRIYRS